MVAQLLAEAYFQDDLSGCQALLCCVRLVWWFGAPLHQFQQDAARPLGMEKDAAPVGSLARRLVKYACSSGAKLIERTVNIGYLQADMVQPAAVLLQKAGDAALRVGGFEQFDFASVGAAEREKCYTYTFLWEIEDTGRHNTEHIAVKV